MHLIQVPVIAAPSTTRHGLQARIPRYASCNHQQYSTPSFPLVHAALYFSQSPVLSPCPYMHLTAPGSLPHSQQLDVHQQVAVEVAQCLIVKHKVQGTLSAQFGRLGPVAVLENLQVRGDELVCEPVRAHRCGCTLRCQQRRACMHILMYVHRVGNATHE